jgi:starch synthase (maltosyl-transferring)
LRQVIARVNRIRRDNRALQSNHNFRFHPIDNDQIIAYSKATHDLSNLLVMVVNLDPSHTQSGWLDLPLEEFEIDPHQAYQVHDLLGEGRYFWQGARNFVQLNPHVLPAHILSVRRRVRTEQDFDYFM